MALSDRQKRQKEADEAQRAIRSQIKRNHAQMVHALNESGDGPFHVLAHVPALPDAVLDALREAKRTAPEGRQPSVLIVAGKYDLDTRVYALIDITDDDEIERARGILAGESGN